MRETKVSFINIANRKFNRYQLQGLAYPPLWALTLMSSLNKLGGLDLELYDLNVKSERIKKADVFLLSGLNQDYDFLIEMYHQLRESFPHSLILIGGPICWSFEQKKELGRLSLFDHIFIGDGEVEVVDFFRKYKDHKLPQVIKCRTKFNLKNSIPIVPKHLQKFSGLYSGGSVEVSRGCPFLCDFCDIRVMDDNNRAHCRDINSIITDIETFHQLGMKFIFITCDNFNASLRWAEELCERIITWRETSGAKISFYTWCTISLKNQKNLLKKMRLAGFDTLFIGIESFNKNSLIEASKIQNVKIDLVNTIKLIQSFGFIVYAGLIMGFDGEDDSIVDVLTDGILESGLISGDITPLMALPGTPLYKRLNTEGRLRNSDKASLGYTRYSSNMIYSRKSSDIKNDFIKYFKIFNSGKYQRKRLYRFFNNLNSNNYIKVENEDYSSIGQFFIILKRDPFLIFKTIYRFLLIFKSFERTINLFIALIFTLKLQRKNNTALSYFKFWLFAWTTSLVKNDGIKAENMDLVGYDEQDDIESIYINKIPYTSKKIYGC